MMVVPILHQRIYTELLSERAKKAIATCKCAVYTAGDLAAETGVTIAMR